MVIVDDFATKIRNSGYCIKQTREIRMRGLKGYERNLNLSRRHKKILSKSNWFERSGFSQDEQPASKRVRPQEPNPDDGISSHKEG